MWQVLAVAENRLLSLARSPTSTSVSYISPRPTLPQAKQQGCPEQSEKEEDGRMCQNMVDLEAIKSTLAFTENEIWSYWEVLSQKSDLT